jgi:bifunctional pyridoxal-dependent enzyme with beta-cystathionase and maltose regulon repressor activities
VKTSLLTELSKHSAYSEALRQAHISKTANISGLDRAVIGLPLKALKAGGKAVMKRPLKSLSLLSGVAQASAAYQAAKPQFNQDLQRAQMDIGTDGLPNRGR